MQHKLVVSNAEKVISILSYFSMGIVGLLLIFLAYLMNKRLKFFLMYNIGQSIFIAFFLASINFLMKILFKIALSIPVLNNIGININMFFQRRLQLFGLSFNIVETFVFLLLIYISLGIILGKIFKIPFLTKFMKKVMISYK